MGNDLLTGFLAGQSDNNGGNNNGGGFFGNEGLWAVIILAIIFGWGRNGSFGGQGGGGDSMTGALPYILANNSSNGTSGEIQRGFDTAAITGQLTSIANGLCSLGYDQLAQMNGINANIANGFHGVDNAICTLGYQMGQGFNGVERGQNQIQNQIASCCCETQRLMERGFSDIGNRMATDTCAINTNAANNTRDIIDAMNCGFRGIEARMTAQELAAKDAQITAQQQKIFGLELAASQAAQNTYLVGQLRPAPVPAFSVPAPWMYGNCGCNTGYSGGGCCGNNYG